MKHKTSGGELTLLFEEDLISTAARPLLVQCKELMDEERERAKVVADLSKVKMVDSQGLNLLVAIYQECKKKNREFQAAGVSSSLKNLFDFVKMSERFGL